MLLNFSSLVKKYNVTAKGVIVVGAHYAEEHPDYLKAGIEKFIYIEPCKETFKVLQSKLMDGDAILINCACGEKSERRIMYTGSQNEGQSNSLLRMQKHLDIHPGITLPTTEIVQVENLDQIMAHQRMHPIDYNLLVMDCQGYEGRVIKGAASMLNYIDYIYTEVNRDEVYRGCTLVDELDELLRITKHNEFVRVETGSWVGGMWSDAFYVRKTLLQ